MPRRSQSEESVVATRTYELEGFEPHHLSEGETKVVERNRLRERLTRL
jgi:hypothetical protein